MIQKHKCNSSKYTSCIKINGTPILPPLITPSKSEKLLDYKQKAIEVEKRITEKLNKNITAICNSETSLENNVPCRSTDCLNLTCDLVEVSEYSGSGIRIFSDTKSITESNLTEHDDSLHEKKDLNSSFDEFERKAPPLIRSNSYTLESPSPILLAHLRSLGLESSFEDDNTLQVLTSPDSAKSNIETEDKPFPGEIIKEGALKVEANKENDCATDSKSETLEQQTLHDSMDNNLIDEDAFEHSVKPQLQLIPNSLSSEDKKDIVITEIDMELLKALNNLASSEKEQILLSLKSQNYGQLNLNFLPDKENSSSTISDTSANFLCEAFQGVVTQTSKFSETKIDIFDKNDDIVVEKIVSNTVVRNILNCSKEISHDDDFWLQQRLKQEWAASVIVAHVKGYLTRRLMATERVRGLIETIKDALICAVELHNETVESINESDVELHRRLVQQISAACYAFYDVFFSLSKAEQMAIIAHDRKRLKEKALKNVNLN